jgi:uncharacterized damage-inducible protein DinB
VVPETQRNPVPRNDGGELDTALGFLSFARESVLKKTEGLDDEQLRRVMVPTGTSILGLVWHVTVSEQWWFGYHLIGRYDDDPDEATWDFEMAVPAGRSSAEIIQGYRDAIADSDTILGGYHDPEALTARTVDGAPKSLRWVLAHMTSETARHAGHADILREQIDGVTGR